MFINLADNTFLDRQDAPFAPIGDRGHGCRDEPLQRLRRCPAPRPRPGSRTRPG
jgi:hypothetical protein